VHGAGSDRSKPREQLPEQKRRALEPAKSSATKSSKPIRHRRFQPLTTWPRFSALAGPALERRRSPGPPPRCEERQR